MCSASLVVFYCLIFPPAYIELVPSPLRVISVSNDCILKHAKHTITNETTESRRDVVLPTPRKIIFESILN